uniref:Uncharacterized protein n=1 Tax=Moniliophthora roreri TaxID=221103 RepID=A0A0W0FR76_MONRR
MDSQTPVDLQRRGLSLYISPDDHLTFSSIVVGPIIVLGLQLPLYGFYCIVIRLALQELRKSKMKTREYQFHRTCLLALFILASINVPTSTVRVIGRSAYGFYTLQDRVVSDSKVTAVLGFILDLFTALILFLVSTFVDAILIFRCYAVWGFRLRIVIAPIIGCIAVDVLGMTMLGLRLRYGTDEIWSSRTQLGIGVYLIGNACMNILLTLMIAGRIRWTAREARGSLSGTYLQWHKMISSLIIESGFLFPTVLVCGIFFNVTPSLYGWDLTPLLIQVAGIAPTLIIVRARRRLSDNESSTASRGPSQSETYILPTYSGSRTAGPLEDARVAWLNFLNAGSNWPPKDGEWVNLPGYPVPTKPVDEIVTITPEDGKIWEDWVVVGPMWAESWVSPPACDSDGYGGVEVDGKETDEWNTNDEAFLRIHRHCLSFVCRRNSLTPRVLWESLYGSDADYKRFGENGNGLLYCVRYLDMTGRTGQFFGYAAQRSYDELKGPKPAEVYTWLDPESMEDTKWILADPNILPTPQTIGPSIVQAPETTSRRLFDVPELLNAMLDEIVCLSTQKADQEIQDSIVEVFDPPSAITAVRTLLSLAQVDRWFYRAIIRERQGYFLRVAQNFGWTLPCTPADWSKWPENLTPISSAISQDIDWRAYLLTCLRKEDVHVRSRWRLHRMAVQFARGVDGVYDSSWHWNAGQLGLKPSLEKPEAEEWEIQ